MVDADVTGIELATPSRLPAARPQVVFGTEWNAWRASVMPQPPKKFRRAPLRPGQRVLGLMASQYPSGATGQGYTSGRVTLPHVTASEWQEETARRLPAPQPMARLGAPRAGGEPAER